MYIENPQKHGLKYNPFKALVAPRPIAWVSSLSYKGVPNLAPYSFFNAVADSPPMVMFCPNSPKPGGGPKDTLSNCEQTGDFVINLCNYDLREHMNATSAHFPPEVDEFEKAGLTAVASSKVKSPRIKEAPVSLECEFLFRVRLPSTHPKIENNTVFGKVVAIHIADELIVDGRVDMMKYRPISRLGYMDYSVLDNVFSMERPDDTLDAYEAAKRKAAAE
jgi:flavin reductase (DIM6/NTAB) family NADH-FMN oxidoreductase RutF